MLELVGHPGPQTTDGTGRAQGVLRVDVHVVVVDRRGHRHLVGGEAGGVVQRPPVGARGEFLGGLAEGTQRGVGVEHPGVHGLAGEQQRSVVRERLRRVELGNSARTRSADQAVGRSSWA